MDAKGWFVREGRNAGMVREVDTEGKGVREIGVYVKGRKGKGGGNALRKKG